MEAIIITNALILIMEVIIMVSILIMEVIIITNALILIMVATALSKSDATLFFYVNFDAF